MFKLPMTIAAAALLCGAPALAQTKPAPKPTPTKAAAKPAPVVKPAAVAAKPAPAAAAAKPAPRKPAPAAAGRMVTTKTSTGKTITYNCSKAGNANKAACK